MIGKHLKNIKMRATGWGLLLGLALPLAQTVPATADDDFYKGKVLTIVVGYPPGGGYDAYARLMTNQFAHYLPGNPSVVIQNMPGASAITAANYIARKAPKDGTFLLAFSASAAFAQTFGNAAATYTADEFTWIGNFDQSTDTCTVGSKSGIGSFQDLLKQPTIFGASGPIGVDSEYARALNALFGTRMRVIHGYGGTPSVNLAIERGEIQGGCGYMLSSLQSVYRDDFTSGKLVPIVQFARKSDDLKGVPWIVDYAKSETDKQAYSLIFSRDILGRPIAAPPGLPPERTAALRAAFDAVTKDAIFIQAAQKANLPVEPMSGADVAAFVRDMLQASPDAIARARSALAFGENDQLRSLDGVVTALDGTDLRITDTTGAPHAVRVSSAASKIMVAGQQAEPNALKPGMSCSLRYLNEGDVAETIACK